MFLAESVGLFNPSPPEARLEQRLEATFGIIHSGGPPVRVVLRFSGAEVSQYVLEKTWLTEKRKTIRRDGSVERQFEATALEDVASWIRSFGAAVEVLEPGLTPAAPPEFGRWAMDNRYC
jgi:hypothetical protein